MRSQIFFTVVVLAVFLQRLIELRISRRNADCILTQGGQEHDDNLLGVVKGLQISWFVLMLAEVWFLERPFIPGLAIVALTAVMLGQTLRYLSMKALEWRWTLPIMTVPGMPLVEDGIYRYLRHPNWLGVGLEIFALPLVHTAYLTAIVFSLINTWVLYQRMQTEQQILRQNY